MAVDPKAFSLISYGMYIVSSFGPGRLNGQIATTVFQVTSEPPMMAVSLNCQNYTNELIKGSQKFSVAVLSQEAPLTLIGTFGFKCGRQVDKFSGMKYEICSSGNPKLLEYSLANFDVEVTQTVELGSHTLFIGKVVESQILAEGHPMTYEYYHKIKGGKTQQNAPSYIKG
ncbi:flavin reductase family protein [candidate division TA06 bacterium]|uniref:Flavin reductase family protein n=1 Tax=candidate division TA06 bacterium TaxID=2250710 RepID=A0A933IC95_UNCT6|nr:flavin reductase family protein [candidate division TA06 bacterium]